MRIAYLRIVPVLILLSMSALSAASMPQYTVTDLGTFGGNIIIALAVNNSGQVVGYGYDASGVRRPFVWEKGTGLTDLSSHLGDGIPQDINSFGKIVGQAGNGNAFLYSLGSEPLFLGALGSHGSHAMAINDENQVVGMSCATFPYDHAFHWQQGTGMTGIGTLSGGLHSQANGINNHGVIAGRSTIANGEYRGFVYTSDSGMVELETVGGDYGEARDINDVGQIVGISTNQQGKSRATLWRSGFPALDLGSLDNNVSYAHAIDNSGRVVGSTTAGGFARAFIWSETSGMVNLNSLIDTDSGWVLWEATDISDTGFIVGRGYGPNGMEKAFLLTPVPEPSSILALAAGGMALFSVRRRKRRR